MTIPLFEVEATPEYAGDPLRPDTTTVTPPEIVARLTGPEREQRVLWLIDQAHHLMRWAIETQIINQKRNVAAKCILFSGGNDSTVLAHLFKDDVDYAVHANTTIGIEQTRQFVRDTCRGWGLELLERFPPKSYRELVKETGFPGPQFHWRYYTRLKERVLEAVRNELVSNPYRERVLYIAGRRRSESKRRVNVPLSDRKGSMVFASPIAMWTKLDMMTYRLMFRESLDPVPVNEVSEILHMSGECLCGAFAKENELDEIRFWFPDVAEEIDSIAEDVRAAGHKWPLDTWGHRNGAPSQKTGLMCSSCEFTHGVKDPEIVTA